MPDSPNGATGGYAEVLEQARRAVGEARVADPNDHFPYKKDKAKAAIAEDMKPDARDEDVDVTGADVMSDRIADASEAYVAAQEALLLDPTSAAKKAAYEVARDDLVAARRAHRSGRVGPDGNPATGGAIIGTTDLPLPPHQQGQPRARRAGED